MKQQRAGLAGQRAQAVVEAGRGQHHAAIGQHRLGDHAGDVAVGQRSLERRQIVELDDLRVLR